jgi:hypothetical protein
LNQKNIVLKNQKNIKNDTQLKAEAIMKRLLEIGNKLTIKKDKFKVNMDSELSSSTGKRKFNLIGFFFYIY